MSPESVERLLLLNFLQKFGDIGEYVSFEVCESLSGCNFELVVCLNVFGEPRVYISDGVI